MRYLPLALAACVTLTATGAVLAQSAAPAAADPVAAALADAGRPAEEKARDAARKPAEMVAFAEIGRGDRVADFLPAGGYFTRVFAKVVGPNGHIHALVPEHAANMFGFGESAKKLAAAYPNVSADIVPLNGFNPTPKVDVFWTAQNYHDAVNINAQAPGILNKAAFDALKPGGLYIVIDHTAAASSGIRDTKTLHRIDPAVVRREVEAAGFVFVAESRAVRNAADPLTANVFDPAIRGKTDQFAFKFKKPG